MNQKIVWSILGVAVLFGLGWWAFGPESTLLKQSQESAPESSVPSPIPSVAAPSVPGRSITIPLSAQNNSGESGQAVLTEMGDRLKVVLDFSGAPAGVVQPAHIHTGSCATIGGVKYGLNFPRDGKSETMLDVSLDDLIAQLPLAINVHKSASESNIYVSCGDIVAPSAGTSSSQDAQKSSSVTEDQRGEGGPFATPTDKRKGADKPED